MPPWCPPTPDPAAIERRIVSVLFADLVGFTSLSERLDPEDVASVQDAYFATVRDTVGRYGGEPPRRGILLWVIRWGRFPSFLVGSAPNHVRGL